MPTTAVQPVVIERAYIHASGDTSAGVGGENAVLAAEGDYLLDLSVLDEAERSAVIEGFRGKLQEALSVIWDESPQVIFDFEDAALTDY